MGFNAYEEVEQHIAENPDGVAELRRKHALGLFGEYSQTIVGAWLRLYDIKNAEALEKEKHDFLKESTEAATRSAKAASRSALWAFLGLLISCGALAFSIWSVYSK